MSGCSHAGAAARESESSNDVNSERHQATATAEKGNLKSLPRVPGALTSKESIRPRSRRRRPSSGEGSESGAPVYCPQYPAGHSESEPQLPSEEDTALQSDALPRTDAIDFFVHRHGLPDADWRTAQNHQYSEVYRQFSLNTPANRSETVDEGSVGLPVSSSFSCEAMAATRLPDSQAAPAGSAREVAVPSPPERVALLPPKDAMFDEELERMLPNLRDIAVSSGHPNIKQGVLYRSARPFASNAWKLRRVLVGKLGIRTVVDLRDDTLAHTTDENASRQLMAQIYRYQIPFDEEMVEESSTARENAFLAPRKSVRTLEQLLKSQGHHDKTVARKIRNTEMSATQVLDEEAAAGTPSSQRAMEANNLLQATQKARLIRIRLMEDRQSHALYVVNIMESERMKQKVMDAVMSSSYLPVIGAARLADKVAGTTLAPFYFCRFLIAEHSLEESYTEMLDCCASRFIEVLKVIVRAEVPILFHCSLGKDRTGIISALILHILGGTDAMIFFDYNLTEYADDAFQAYVRRFCIEQTGLNETFCKAPVEVMQATLGWLKQMYGSVDGFLDNFGFTEGWRFKMREKFLVDPTLPLLRFN